MAAALGGLAGGPGAFDEDTGRRGLAGCGDRPLPPPLTTGIFCGHQAESFHQLAGIVEARQVPEFGDEGDRDSTRDAPQGLQRLDH